MDKKNLAKRYLPRSQPGAPWRMQLQRQQHFRIVGVDYSERRAAGEGLHIRERGAEHGRKIRQPEGVDKTG